VIRYIEGRLLRRRKIGCGVQRGGVEILLPAIVEDFTSKRAGEDGEIVRSSSISSIKKAP